MPERIRIYMTELCVTLGLTTGLASYLSEVNLMLDTLLKLISIVSVSTIVIINYDKALNRIKKFLK
jgi:choline-glycine betaine transporter